LKQILEILWSHRLTVLVALFSCMLGGIYTLTQATPRYRATSRVVLEIVRPDPITGAVVGSRQVDAYMNSQARMITDIQVAARAIENLGWPDDPDMQSAYSARPASDLRSFIEWAATSVAQRTSVSRVPETNILEIAYYADSPQSAGLVVEALRDAYIEASAATIREAAGEQAERIDDQVKRVQARLDELNGQKANMERQTRVMISESGSDFENRSLGALARGSTQVARAKPGAGFTLSEQRLLQLDMAIAASSASLGPNNPNLQSLLQQRAVVAAQVAETRRRQGLSTDAQSLASLALSSKMSQVTAQRLDVTNLRMLQDEINLRRAEYNDLVERRGAAREISRAARASLTPVGGAEVPTDAYYPRPALILGGTGAIGLIVGALLALLREFLDRRVRSAADLTQTIPAPLLLSLPRVGRKSAGPSGGATAAAQ